MTTKAMGLALALLAAALLPSCSRRAEARTRGRRGAGREVLVTVATARAEPIPRQIRTFGTVQSLETVSIRPQVTEILKTVNFRKGQEVHKGQLLFTIDSRTFQASVDQAAANLARDTALAASALKDANRDEALLKKGIFAPTDCDKSRASADALAATVRADRAALDNARVQLGHCRIVSPIDGRIGDVSVTEGNLVTADTTELAVIHQIRPIEVFFSVPETDLPAIRRYMARGPLSVKATIPNDDTGPETGVLTFVDNAVTSQTGTIRLGADFENRSERLWPGLYVQIVLTLTVETDAVVVPAAALQTGREGQYVFMVRKDSTVEVRPVKVDRTSGELAVVASGVETGERVVTDGQLQLTSGTHIRIAPPGPATGPENRTAAHAAGKTDRGARTTAGGQRP